VVPFFAFSPAIRKMIYTTNAVEALHRSLGKIIKTRGSFPNDDAALKLLYLAIKNAGMRWRLSIEWTAGARATRLACARQSACCGCCCEAQRCGASGLAGSVARRHAGGRRGRAAAVGFGHAASS
jgi:hypothetical protein